MNTEAKNYIRGLIPAELPAGKSLLEEGRRIGKTVVPGTNRFLRTHHVKNELEYRKKLTQEGRIIWRAVIGLPTVEMQEEGLKKLRQFSEQSGVRIDTVNQIPNILSGIPEEYRDGSLDFTSFSLTEPEDYIRLAEAAPIQPCFPDFHLISPRAVETTINSIKVGANYVGVFAQFIWDYPNYDNLKEHMSNVVKALGVMAEKREDMFIVDTYLDDGMPGYFMDYTSVIGYALLEQYIVSTLCGARYVASFGQLWNDKKVKMGALLALSDLLKLEDQPGVGYLYGSAIDHWKEHIVGNYGITASEYLMQILVERKYKTGAAIQTIPITEQISVPTIAAVEDILAVCGRLEETAWEWDSIMDFTEIEQYRDLLKEKGLIFFDNILLGFKEAGVNIEDPLQMLWVLKKMDPTKLELFFHPSVAQGSSREFTPCLPSSIVSQSLRTRDGVIEDLKARGMADCLAGKKIIVASADAHWYGAFVVDGVLSAMGAEVINAGVSVDAIDALDLADEEGTAMICVSVHNGQALDYAKQIIELAEERNRTYRICMGGKLNGLMPGALEPIDVSGKMNDVGVFAADNLLETVEILRA